MPVPTTVSDPRRTSPPAGVSATLPLLGLPPIFRLVRLGLLRLWILRAFRRHSRRRDEPPERRVAGQLRFQRGAHRVGAAEDGVDLDVAEAGSGQRRLRVALVLLEQRRVVGKRKEEVGEAGVGSYSS